MAGISKPLRIVSQSNTSKARCNCGILVKLQFVKMLLTAITALTTWYQGYYDIWLEGQYFRKINELHAKYGMSIKTSVTVLS